MLKLDPTWTRFRVSTCADLGLQQTVQGGGGGLPRLMSLLVSPPLLIGPSHFPGTPSNTMPPLSPGRASHTSYSGSSSCYTGCSCSTTSASDISCSTCALRHRQARAARRRPMHTAPRSSASSAVQAPSATSSVPLSAYDNMTSVSQRPPQSSCSGGTRSSTSSAAIARLQSELEQVCRAFADNCQQSSTGHRLTINCQRLGLGGGKPSAQISLNSQTRLSLKETSALDRMAVFVGPLRCTLSFGPFGPI